MDKHLMELGSNYDDWQENKGDNMVYVDGDWETHCEICDEMHRSDAIHDEWCEIDRERQAEEHEAETEGHPFNCHCGACKARSKFFSREY